MKTCRRPDHAHLPLLPFGGRHGVIGQSFCYLIGYRRTWHVATKAPPTACRRPRRASVDTVRGTQHGERCPSSCPGFPQAVTVALDTLRLSPGSLRSSAPDEACSIMGGMNELATPSPPVTGAGPLNVLTPGFSTVGLGFGWGCPGPAPRGDGFRQAGLRL